MSWFTSPKMLCPHKYLFMGRGSEVSLFLSDYFVYWLLYCAESTLVSIWASDLYFMQLWKSNDWYRELKALVMWVPITMLTRIWTSCLPFSLTPCGVPMRVQGSRGTGPRGSHLPRTPSRTWWGHPEAGRARPEEEEQDRGLGLVLEKLKSCRQEHSTRKPTPAISK